MKIQCGQEAGENLLLFYNSKGEIQATTQWKQQEADLVRMVELFLTRKEVTLGQKEVHRIFSPTMQPVYLAGLGDQEDSNSLRSLGGKIGKQLQKENISEVSFLLPEDLSLGNSSDRAMRELLEGTLLGLYQYQVFKQKEKEGTDLESISLITEASEDLETAIRQAMVFAESTNLTRDWCNRPGNYFTPSDFQKQCQAVAEEASLKFSSLDEQEMQELGMGCFLGVTRGSKEPGYINILEYKAENEDAPTLMLVGKGLTFDAGGISLKPSAEMHLMKYDMCGGGAVLGAMRMIGLLKPEINVVALIPTSENLPDGNAVKPGDYLTAYNGKTVEVLNTDAEGRLILADALAYGQEKFSPDAVVDIATLTGAAVIALGSYNAGLLSTDDQLTARLKEASYKTEDAVWEIPGNPQYKKQIEGTFTDLLNIGGREAGMITAGLFLQHFVDKVPHAHLDIAGVADNVAHVDFYPAKGATGAGARLLAELALSWDISSE